MSKYADASILVDAFSTKGTSTRVGHWGHLRLTVVDAFSVKKILCIFTVDASRHIVLERTTGMLRLLNPSVCTRLAIRIAWHARRSIGGSVHSNTTLATLAFLDTFKIK